MEPVYYYAPVITFLVSFVAQGECIRCYFCSYSPDDRNNRTDKCTDQNFQPHKVHVDHCKLGCETFVHYDSNDVMEQWRRNCIQEGHEITNDCKSDKTLGWRHIRCTCDRDLCNRSNAISVSFLAFLTTAVLWSHRAVS